MSEVPKGRVEHEQRYLTPFAAILDDDPNAKATTVKGLKGAFGEQGSRLITTPPSLTDFLISTVGPEANRRPRVVFLDDHYDLSAVDVRGYGKPSLDHRSEQPKLWKITPEDFVNYAEALGRDLSIFRLEAVRAGILRFNSGYPWDLYNTSSITVAMMLRLLGYDGSIVICSSAPPQMRTITNELTDFNSFVSAKERDDLQLSPERLVDGTIAKRPFRGEVFIGYWREDEWHSDIVTGQLSDGLRVLLLRLDSHIHLL